MSKAPKIEYQQALRSLAARWKIEATLCTAGVPKPGTEWHDREYYSRQVHRAAAFWACAEELISLINKETFV
jgi:hypothetical protein